MHRDVTRHVDDHSTPPARFSGRRVRIDECHESTPGAVDLELHDGPGSYSASRSPSVQNRTLVAFPCQLLADSAGAIFQLTHYRLAQWGKKR